MAPDSTTFRWTRRAALGLAALALAATVFAKPKKEEVFLAQLAAMLAGSYDNIAQARGEAGHPGVRLMIVPVKAPLVGDNVFYVQEMAADDLRRVFSQKLWVLNAIPKREQSMLTQLDLKEPVRWRDGQNNRDLFRSDTIARIAAHEERAAAVTAAELGALVGRVFAKGRRVVVVVSPRR